MRLQKTIKEPVEFIGRDIFRGGEGRMIIHPAEHGPGISVQYGENSIKAKLQNVRAVKDLRSRFASTMALVGNGFRILMPEHVIPTIHALGIDNCVIELDQDSFPRFDWGMKTIVEGLEEKLVELKDKPMREVRPLVTQRYNPDSDYDKVVVKPTEGELKITYHAYYPHASIGTQKKEIDMSPDGFKEIMCARGIFFMPFFGSEKWTRRFARLLGFPQEITPENTLIIGSKKATNYLSPIGPNGRDEFVTHKLIDAWAAVAFKSLDYEARITHAHFEFDKTGHQTDLKAMRQFGFVENGHYEARKATISPPNYRTARSTLSLTL